MHAFRIFLVIAVAAVVSACVTTKHPVGTSEELNGDTRLLGAWKAVDPKSGNASYVFFLPRLYEPNWLWAVEASPSHADETGHWQGGHWGSYAITLGKAGEYRFLNAQVLLDNGKPAKSDDYTPVLYRFDAQGALHFSAPDSDAFKFAVERGLVQGTVNENSVLITAEPAALDAYVVAHADELFKPAEIVFRRAD